MLNWTVILWIIGAFLAVSTFLNLANARARDLHGKLDAWLKEELKTISHKKRLLMIARKKRAEIRIQQELKAAQMKEEINKLEISKMLADKEEFERQRGIEIAEKAEEIRRMRNRAA